MAKKNQHVIPVGAGWGVKGEKNARASVITTTQSQAIDYARKLAKQQGSELVIHGRDGKIREKNSYGKDSYPPKG